jgi:hypothetical protein
MRKVLANATVGLGVVVLVYALTWILGLLPVDFMFPADGQAASRYWRAAPRATQDFAYVPYAFAIGGLAILIAGVVLRRGLRSTGA